MDRHRTERSGATTYWVRGGELLNVWIARYEPDSAAFEQEEGDWFPVSREELFEYDVILFGDANPAFFSTSLLNNLADFVRVRGGGLVFLCGPRHTPLAYRGTPLADLMPIVPDAATVPPTTTPLEQSFVTSPTSLGLTSPLVQLSDEPAAVETVWREFPPLRWLVQTGEMRAGARVLVEAKDGIITLRGPILATEAAALLSAVETVRGVRGVADELERHQPGESVPALQGGGPIAGPSVDILQRRWAPATRALVTCSLITAGVLLAAVYAGRRAAA